MFPKKNPSIALIFAIALFSLNACSPKVTRNIVRTTEPIAKQKEVVVYEQNDDEPTGAEFLGNISITDAGMTMDCTYKTVVEMAKGEASKIGGNAIKITKHEKPDINSACHRIEAKVLKVSASDVTKIRNTEKQESQVSSQYAMLYLYREQAYVGSAIIYDVYVNGNKIYKATNNSKTAVKIPNSGILLIEARTESKATLKLRVSPGNAYYVKCGVNMGIKSGRPFLRKMSPSQGKLEYDYILEE